MIRKVVRPVKRNINKRKKTEVESEIPNLYFFAFIFVSLLVDIPREMQLKLMSWQHSVSTCTSQRGQAK